MFFLDLIRLGNPFCLQVFKSSKAFKSFQTLEWSFLFAILKTLFVQDIDKFFSNHSFVGQHQINCILCLRVIFSNSPVSFCFNELTLFSMYPKSSNPMFNHSRFIQVLLGYRFEIYSHHIFGPVLFSIMSLWNQINSHSINTMACCFTLKLSTSIG